MHDHRGTYWTEVICNFIIRYSRLLVNNLNSEIVKSSYQKAIKYIISAQQ